MEEILNEIVPQADLEKFERNYHKELENQDVTPKTQFEYAWCLVRSGYKSDIEKGILLLEDIYKRDRECKRDYIYYLAIGNARLKKYTDSLKYCKSFLQIEPNNQQVIALEDYIKTKMGNESMKGLAMASGVVVAIGGLVGLGIALSKK